ncbi:hypothetical protein MNKW57_30940 [Biformimicrobium ophioploci]|uniref:Uncharacterized protein n=1 Tax=Biformimicrobium ophioploci TaxID=3036711 RepID=A0ABQ6M366_9GAMM|nr:hypothetical protein MNKW57_30940 [Microbulbifer sp. NKW57]
MGYNFYPQLFIGFARPPTSMLFIEKIILLSSDPYDTIKVNEQMIVGGLIKRLMGVEYIPEE